jgi:Heme/copper-type cytochrome/quinol oxidases, subunit 2
VGKLFAAAVTVIALVSAGVFISHTWWLPPDVSALGIRIDGQIFETMIFTGTLFVAAQLALAAFVLQSSGRTSEIKFFPGGPMPMVVLATVIVGLEVLSLVFVGTKVWSQIFLAPAEANAIHIDVQAGQFAFYFRYPGPDGKSGVPHPEKIDEGNSNFFGLDPKNDTAARDDIVSASLVVPVNQPILLTMHSKDVGHSLFIPEMRLQQDFVPGLIIPVHFTATGLTKTEIVCTQLCGLGHYNMKAYLTVLSREDYDKWLKDKAAQ